MSTAVLHAIAYKPARKAPMVAVDQTQVSKEAGVAQDIFGKPGKRQVTLLSLTQWQAACKEIDTELPWLARRANLLIDGIHLGPELVGQYLQIGPDLVLKVTGETDPCKNMALAHPKLEQALTSDWRGGVTCQVITSGHIHEGDPVRLLPAHS